MAARRVSDPTLPQPRRRRAKTPEARENQLVSLAFDLAEQQMREGTASAQVITHYLKAGAQRERLEREKIFLENELLKAKKEAIESAQDMKVLYEDAMKAMSSYQGNPVEEDEFYDD